ncbi:MAG: sulfurtransferase [Gammaproteobacteria bacterium]|nr:sulfurtransferase [Gammaproteobacteria bacterium]MDH3506206.1 sulfurtransferase [Gammaproteobacteria bacterium]
MRLRSAIRLRFTAAVLAGLGCISGATLGWAQDAGSVLVNPDWLAANIDRADVRLIDLGKRAEEFEAAHIPNAQHVDWRTDLADPANREHFGVLQPEAFEALMSRLGIAADTTVVLYDSHSNRVAARMFWTLRNYGHRDIRILDGGSPAWEAAGGELTAESMPVTPTDYRISIAEQPYRAEKADVQAALGREGFEIVDARAPQFYTGESRGSRFGSDVPNAKIGRVPGAQNFFWADHVNDDGTYKSIDELRTHYEALGITSEDNIITYCHIGLQASTPWFVLTQLLGYPNVRLYDGSMAEWANADDTELVVDEND